MIKRVIPYMNLLLALALLFSGPGKPQSVAAAQTQNTQPSSTWISNPVGVRARVQETANFDVNWHTFLGANSSLVTDKSRSIAADGEGNTYVVGETSAQWNETPLNAYSGSIDSFLVKLNSSGSLVWYTFMGGISNDRANAVTLDGNGNIYVTGYSEGTWGSPKRTFTSGSSDTFVAKFGSDGSLLWNTFLGGSSVDVGSGIAVDTSGNVFVTGDSYAAWSCTPVSCTSRSYDRNDDAFVAKLDNAGNLVWNTFLGSSGDDMGKGVALDSSGNVFVTGQTSGYWKEGVQTNHCDAFVAELANSNGSIIWRAFVGGASNDYGKGIAIDSSGKIYLSGNSEGSWGNPVRAYTSTTSYSYDVFAAKYENNGTLLWNTFLGGGGNDLNYGVAVDSNGNVQVTGESSTGWGANPAQAYSGGDDAFVSSLGSDGHLIGNTFLGSSGDDTGYNIQADQGGHVFVVGLSRATWGANPVRAFSPSGDAGDVFVAKLSTPPNVSLSQTASPASGKPGDTITFTVNFNNPSANPASQVVIRESLPSEISGISYTSSGVPLTLVSSSPYVWNVPDLAMNQGGTIHISGVLAKPLAAGTYTSTAVLAAPGIETLTSEVAITVLNVAPQAGSGSDQTVSLNRSVTLDGSGSSDENGDALTYDWAQTGGPAVLLSSSAGQKPTFTAPSTPAVLTFQLTTRDSGGLTGTDEVVVHVENSAPVFADLSDQSVDELSPLIFTASASDSDVPSQSLTYSLDAGAPAGASINPTSGVFTWTPGEDQGPYTYPVTIHASDGVDSDSITVNITVNEVNTDPKLEAIADQSLDELASLTFNAAASDTDLPSNHLTFSLDAGSPAGASIDPSTGKFTWRPTQEQGPGRYDITVRVSDGMASASRTFAVTVNEVVSVDAGPDQTVPEGRKVIFAASTDEPNVTSIQWDFGDGTTASGSFTTDHVYHQPGVYTATITITLQSQVTISNTLVVTVTPPHRIYLPGVLR